MARYFSVLAQLAAGVLLFCAAGCMERAYVPKLPEPGDVTGVTNGMGRAEPGYVQWLERKSMLAQTAELDRLVGASARQWSAPSLPPQEEVEVAMDGVATCMLLAAIEAVEAAEAAE